MRSISLNAHYIVIFRQTRDISQIGVLARQIFGNRAKEFIDLYDEAMETLYNYVLINIHPSNTKRISVHLNIFPPKNEIVYI